MASTRPSVFVDTNVLFSALYSKTGNPAKILQLHLDNSIELVVSLDVLEELVRELPDKIPGGRQMLQFILLASPPTIVSDPSAEEIDAALIQVNPAGAPIWAAAIAARPDYFVTGDRRFLREARVAQTSPTVLTPRELIDQLERSH